MTNDNKRQSTPGSPTLSAWFSRFQRHLASRVNRCTACETPIDTAINVNLVNFQTKQDNTIPYRYIPRINNIQQLTELSAVRTLEHTPYVVGSSAACRSLLAL